MARGEWQLSRFAASLWGEGAVPTHCCASFCCRPLSRRSAWKHCCASFCCKPLSRRSGTDALLCVVLLQASIAKERYRRTAVRRFVASPYLEGAHRRTALRRFVAGLSIERAHRRTAVRHAIIPLSHHFNGGQAKKSHP
jgi:hypothetical protein